LNHHITRLGLRTAIARGRARRPGRPTAHGAVDGAALRVAGLRLRQCGARHTAKGRLCGDGTRLSSLASTACHGAHGPGRPARNGAVDGALLGVAHLGLGGRGALARVQQGHVVYRGKGLVQTHILDGAAEHLSARLCATNVERVGAAQQGTTDGLVEDTTGAIGLLLHTVDVVVQHLARTAVRHDHMVPLAHLCPQVDKVPHGGLAGHTDTATHHGAAIFPAHANLKVAIRPVAGAQNALVVAVVGRALEPHTHCELTAKVKVGQRRGRQQLAVEQGRVGLGDRHGAHQVAVVARHILVGRTRRKGLRTQVPRNHLAIELCGLTIRVLAVRASDATGLETRAARLGAG